VSLTPGTRLGPYEISAQIGAGGMGEVYRATDTNLARKVAIKVLPESMAADAERLARFDREAKTLAALNHPNIAAIYGLERSDGQTALVMELVEGPTLADRIAEGPIPVDEALPIAKQITDALAAAHEQSITHRDLKPANVKVRPDGTVKVLDFGLAKAIDTNPAPQHLTRSPTITTPAMTQAGVILGTAPYMSPEQARGQQVDKRADIWAFGVVLYETVTGRRPFDGETISDTLASVLKSEPDLQPVPASVRPLLQACLEKDPGRRLRDIGDVWRLFSQTEPVVARAKRTPWIVAAASIAVVAAALWAPWRAAPVVPEITRLQLDLPDGVTLSAASPFAISPDGRSLAFVAAGPDNVSSVWIRSLDSFDARRLPGTETTPTTPAPFWSPDSRSLAFTSNSRLKKVDVNGGSVQVLADLPLVAPGGSWNSNGVIILAQTTSGIVQMPASGGAFKQLTTVDRSRMEVTHNNPVFLPDGRHFLYLRSSLDPNIIGIYIGSLDLSPQAQSTQRLVNTSLSADYAVRPTPGTGYLLFRREGSLLAQPFDDQTMKLSGEPAVVAERLSSYFSGGLFSVSRNGVLVYRAGDAARSSRLILLDRQGNQVSQVGEPGAYSNVAISPDGTQAVVRRTDYGSSDLNLWILDLKSGATRRLTRERVSAASPVWSPDGTFIAYDAVGRRGLYRTAVNGGASEEVLVDSQQGMTPLSWSRDGNFLLYTSRDPKTGDDLWALPLHGERKPIAIAASEWSETDGEFSPDGKWVAYVSNDSDHREIYVRSFSPRGSADGAVTPVSRGGGGRPRWRADGKELFYLSGNGNLMSVDITPGPTFRAGPPKALFQLPRGTAFSDTDREGRTLAVVPLQSGTQAPFNIVLNWQSGLKP
jgi:serine/threonine protein kinase